MARAMLRATSGAPRRFASKAERCLYTVPTSARSRSSRTGELIAPGRWSSANSAWLRASITASKRRISASASGVATWASGRSRWKGSSTTFSTRRRGRGLPEKGFERGPDVVADEGLRLRARVQLVGEEELCFLRDALEEERHERNLVLRRDLAEDVPELAGVIDAIIRRNHEAHEHRVGARVARHSNHPLEVGAYRGDR